MLFFGPPHNLKPVAVAGKTVLVRFKSIPAPATKSNNDNNHLRSAPRGALRIRPTRVRTVSVNGSTVEVAGAELNRARAATAKKIRSLDKPRASQPAPTLACARRVYRA